MTDDALKEPAFFAWIPDPMAEENIRDRIAIAAMQGMLVFSPNPFRERITETAEKCVAEQAYKYADAMLEARKK